jgi:heme exporter protein D
MIGENQETIYIVLSYVGVALVTLALIGSAWAGSRRAHRRLAALEAQGIRRRSAGPAR